MTGRDPAVVDERPRHREADQRDIDLLFDLEFRQGRRRPARDAVGSVPRASRRTWTLLTHGAQSVDKI